MDEKLLDRLEAYPTGKFQVRPPCTGMLGIGNRAVNQPLLVYLWEVTRRVRGRITRTAPQSRP